MFPRIAIPSTANARFTAEPRGPYATDEAFKDQQIVNAFYKLLMERNRTRGDDFQVLIEFYWAKVSTDGVP